MTKADIKKKVRKAVNLWYRTESRLPSDFNISYISFPSDVIENVNLTSNKNIMKNYSIGGITDIIDSGDRIGKAFWMRYLNALYKETKKYA